MRCEHLFFPPIRNALSPPESEANWLRSFPPFVFDFFFISTSLRPSNRQEPFHVCFTSRLSPEPNHKQPTDQRVITKPKNCFHLFFALLPLSTDMHETAKLELYDFEIGSPKQAVYDLYRSNWRNYKKTLLHGCREWSETVTGPNELQQENEMRTRKGDVRRVNRRTRLDSLWTEQFVLCRVRRRLRARCAMKNIRCEDYFEARNRFFRE